MFYPKSGGSSGLQTGVCSVCGHLNQELLPYILHVGCSRTVLPVVMVALTSNRVIELLCFFLLLLRNIVIYFSLRTETLLSSLSDEQTEA